MPRPRRAGPAGPGTLGSAGASPAPDGRDSSNAAAIGRGRHADVGDLGLGVDLSTDIDGLLAEFGGALDEEVEAGRWDEEGDAAPSLRLPSASESVAPADAPSWPRSPGEHGPEVPATGSEPGYNYRLKPSFRKKIDMKNQFKSTTTELACKRQELADLQTQLSEQVVYSMMAGPGLGAALRPHSARTDSEPRPGLRASAHASAHMSPPEYNLGPGEISSRGRVSSAGTSSMAARAESPPQPGRPELPIEPPGRLCQGRYSDNAPQTFNQSTQEVYARTRQLFTSLEDDAYAGPCEISGRLPVWLEGTLLRTGPGLWECGSRQLKHVVDGFTIVGALKISGSASTADAAQRFVDCEPYRAARRGELIVDKFASRKRFSSWGLWAQDRLRALMGTRYLEQSWGRIVPVGGQLVSVCSSNPGTYSTLDVASLSLQEHAFADDLSIDSSILFASLDPDGASYNFLGISLGLGLVLYQIVNSTGGGLVRIVTGMCTPRHASRPPFIPCVASSLKYRIIFEAPLYINPNKLMQLSRVDSDDDDETNDSYYMFDWEPTDVARVHLVSRETGQASVWALPELFFGWTVINAQDLADGYCVIDVAATAAPTLLKCLALRKRRAPPEAGLDFPYQRLVRIRVPVDVARGGHPPLVTMSELCSPEAFGHHFSNHTIDPRRTGRRYQFAYGCSIMRPRPCTALEAICRIDMHTGEVARWYDASGPSVISGNPTFVPRPGAPELAETDGCLLVDCLGPGGRAFYSVLDLESFTETARVLCPYRHCVSWSTTWVWTVTRDESTSARDPDPAAADCP